MLRNLKVILPFILLSLLLLSSSDKARAQAPVAAFNANDTIVCIGSALSFTDASIAGANPIASWDWNFGDGGTSTDQDPTYTFSIAGTFTTQLIITDALGLKDTATQIVYVVEANVNQSLIRLCAPANSTTISAVDQAVAGVNSYWLSPSPTVVIANALNDTTLVSNLAPGLNTIFWVVAYGSCTLADQVSVFVDTQINANAGTDQQICSTPGTTNLAGNSPNPGTGLWTTTSSATITNPNNRNSGVTSLNVAGTYTFVWTITNGACVSRDTMVITVSSPITSNAGADQTVCTTSGTATLVGSSPSTGTGLWTTTSSAIITSPSNTTTTITGLTIAGNYNFVWTITNGTCVTRDTIRIVVTAPVVSNAGNDIQVCTSTGIGTLNGNNPSPGTGLWTVVTSGTITSPTNTTTTITGLTTAGFYSFVWTITNGPCISRDTVTIIVRNPVVANAGSDQSFCNTSTTTLIGNSPSPGTALWTTTGSATITSPTSATTTVSNLVIGNNTFIYTTSLGACISRDTVIVRRDSLVTSNAGPDQQICESFTSITLAGNNPSPGTGVWTKTNGGTITTPSSATSTVTGLTAGTHNFIWTITNGSCISRDTMRVVVNSQVASNAGLDEQVCQGTTSSVSGNNPTPAIGLWTTTSSATIAAPASPNTNISGLTNAGVYTFIWTVTNGACVLRDTARITVDSSIAANAGIDKSVCTVNSTTLLANNPTPGIGLWTSLGSAGVSNPNLAAATATSLVYGNNFFVWTITNGSCINRDTINVIRDSLVTARAGADRSVCSSASSLNLAGNTPASGTGLWTTTSLASIITPSSPTSAIAGYSTPGSYTFVWTITNGSCTSRDTVVITVDQAITANAGADQSICSSTSSITMAGSNPAPGIGIWTALGAGTIAAPNSANTNITALGVGANIFTWTIINGGCTSEDTVVINVSQLVTSNAGPNQTVCQGTTVTLAGNSHSPGIGVWSAINGGTISNTTSQNPTVSGLSTAGTYNFVWTITNGSCVNTDTVAIIISGLIASNAGSDQNLCAVSTTTLAGNNPAPGIGQWTTTSLAIIAAAGNQNTTVSGLSFGSNEFIWTITNGNCVNKDTIYIVVDSIIVSDAGADQQICAGTSTILSASDAFPGIGLWTALNGGILGDPSLQNTTIDGLNIAGSYAFVWTVTNGVCESSDTTFIVVDSLIVADAGVDQKYCEIFGTSLTANDFTPGFGTWSTNGSSTISDPNDPATLISDLSYGANEFIWTITNGTCTTSDTVIVNVDSLIVANAGADQIICAGSVLSLTGNSPGVGFSDWVAVDEGTITDPTLQSITISDLNTAGIYSFEYSISNGVCFSLDTVVITVDSLTAANAGVDQTLCNTFNSSLNGNTVLPGIGNWSTSGGATFTDVNDPLTSVANLDFGANIFIWSVTNGVCTSEDSVSIFVDSVIVADAGADQTICSTTGYTTLSANDPLTGQGLWTTSSLAIFADSSANLSFVSSLNFVGTYQLVWSINNGVCISTDTVVVNVDSNEVANAGVDQQYCESITSANLNATPASVGVGAWTSLGTAIVVDSANPNSQVDDLILGDNLFVYTIINGTCIETDTINIIISQLATPANAGLDQEQCASNLSALITGNIPLIGLGSWTSLGVAIVDSVSSASTTVSNLQIGNNFFVYSIVNGACVSSDTVNVIVNPLPIVDAGLDQFVTSLTPVVIGGTPTVSGGSGTYLLAWSPASVLNDSTLSNPTATVDSTTQFTVLVTDSLGCQGLDSVIVWINNSPIASNDSVVINEDSVVVINVILNDTDIDNNINPSSLTAVAGPFNGTILIDTITGFITYTPNANYYGADSIFYSVCDSGMPVYCDTAWIYINILPINDAPLALDDVATTVEDSCIQIAVLANDSDIENAIVVTSLVTFSGPSNGTLTLDTLTGIITYCPDSNFAGIDTFYYAICDSGFPAPGLCDTAIVIINVNTNNDPPIALNDSAVICSSDSAIITILGNDIDPDNDSLSVSILTSSANGTALLGSTFELYYTPDSLFNGVDSIQYVVCDNQPIAGCDTAWAYITVHVVPQISLVSTDIKCFGDSSGTVDLSVLGNAPYIYTWSNGSVDEDIDSLYANTYIILVTDNFGCTNTSFVTVNQPLVPLSGLLNTQPVLCNGDSSGAFDLVVSGGVTPYTYTWSNGDTAEDIDSLVVGNYTVVVVDSNGCMVTLSDSIIQPDSALSAITIVQNINCGGDSTGAISITVAGGTGGYLYAWSNSETSASIVNLSAGLYTVTINDNNNCQLVVTDSIRDLNSPISIISTISNPNCITGILGAISLVTTGGVGQYNYQWNTGDSTSNLDSLTTGSYSLTVSDSIGCFDTITFLLVDSSAALINVLGNVDICEGDSIVLEASNLVGSSYQWSQNGNILLDTTYQLVVDTAGIFDVTITNGCGVFTSSPVSTTLNPIPALIVSNDISVPCDSLITLSVSGASTYSWAPANLVSDSTGSLVTVSLDQTTTFAVTGFSSAGCASFDTIVVTVTCDTLFLPSGFSPNGDGKNDFFVISNLAKYPNATLKIFNRWGNLVYIKDRYDNSWNGFSNSDKVRLGEELPNGTYFYVFEPNNGEESKQGFVILRR
jgi:gliding motility-associated-like protein